MADHHTFFGKLFASIAKIFNKVKDEIKDDILPWSISVVNGLKKLEESDLMKILVTALGKEKGQDILDKVHAATVKIALALDMVDLANKSFGTDEEKVMYIVKQIKLSSDEKYDAFWHSMAYNLIHALSDGKVTISEAMQIVQTAFLEETDK